MVRITVGMYCAQTTMTKSSARGALPRALPNLSWDEWMAAGTLIGVCLLNLISAQTVSTFTDRKKHTAYYVITVLLITVQRKLSSLVTAIVPVPEHHPTETIVLRTGTAASTPCITLPHGGPHSASSTTFNAWATTFALDGCESPCVTV